MKNLTHMSVRRAGRNGWFVVDLPRKILSQTEYQNISKWIDEHIVGMRVLSYTESKVAFKDEGDAVMFHLKWS